MVLGSENISDDVKAKLRKALGPTTTSTTQEKTAPREYSFSDRLAELQGLEKAVTKAESERAELEKRGLLVKSSKGEAVPKARHKVIYLESEIREKLKKFLIEPKEDLVYANIAKIFSSETRKGL